MTYFAYSVYGILGIFALRFVFWEIPMMCSSYFKGVLYAIGGISLLIGVSFLFTHYFLIGVMLTLTAAIVLFCLRSL